jgi:hypothetical protein
MTTSRKYPTQRVKMFQKCITFSNTKQNGINRTHLYYHLLNTFSIPGRTYDNVYAQFLISHLVVVAIVAAELLVQRPIVATIEGSIGWSFFPDRTAAR